MLYSHSFCQFAKRELQTRPCHGLLDHLNRERVFLQPFFGDQQKHLRQAFDDLQQHRRRPYEARYGHGDDEGEKEERVDARGSPEAHCRIEARVMRQAVPAVQEIAEEAAVVEGVNGVHPGVEEAAGDDADAHELHGVVLRIAEDVRTEEPGDADGRADDESGEPQHHEDRVDGGETAPLKLIRSLDIGERHQTQNPQGQAYQQERPMDDIALLGERCRLVLPHLPGPHGAQPLQRRAGSVRSLGIHLLP